VKCNPATEAALDQPRHVPRPKKGGVMLIEILVILVIIAVALFIWRNLAGRRV